MVWAFQAVNRARVLTGIGRGSRIDFLAGAVHISGRYLREISEVNLMESISLKLPEDLLEASRRCARALGIPRAE
jgi:hypothetical protein